MRVSYAIVFVSDMSRSVAFYRDVLGLALKFETSHWSEFATEGATLALHVSDATPAGGDEVPGRCRPGFAVPDLAAFHRRMLEAGVPCVEAPRNVFGTEIAQYEDPDGLHFSVSGSRAGS